jgi:hypothetical protein
LTRSLLLELVPLRPEALPTSTLALKNGES